MIAVFLLGVILIFGSIPFYLEHEFDEIPDFVMAVICAGLCLIGCVCVVLASMGI